MFYRTVDNGTHVRFERGVGFRAGANSAQAHSLTPYHLEVQNLVHEYGNHSIWNNTVPTHLVSVSNTFVGAFKNAAIRRAAGAVTITIYVIHGGMLAQAGYQITRATEVGGEDRPFEFLVTGGIPHEAITATLPVFGSDTIPRGGVPEQLSSGQCLLWAQFNGPADFGNGEGFTVASFRNSGAIGEPLTPQQVDVKVWRFCRDCASLARVDDAAKLWPGTRGARCSRCSATRAKDEITRRQIEPRTLGPFEPTTRLLQLMVKVYGKEPVLNTVPTWGGANPPV